MNRASKENNSLLRASRRRQHVGLTLTETVTALLVLGIGVLCIATVYLERTQAAPAVLLHSKASRLAAELADAIKAQRSDAHFENPVGVVCQPNADTTNAQQAIANQMACWQDKVARTLPNGNGAIAHDSAGPTPAYLITVSWSAPNSGTASYLLRLDAPAPASKPATPSPQNVARAAN